MGNSLAEEVRRSAGASSQVPEGSSVVSNDLAPTIGSAVFRLPDAQDTNSHHVDPNALAALEESVLRLAVDPVDADITDMSRLDLPPACRRYYHRLRSRSASAVEVAENVRRALAEEDSHQSELGVVNESLAVDPLLNLADLDNSRTIGA